MGKLSTKGVLVSHNKHTHTHTQNNVATYPILQSDLEEGEGPALNTRNTAVNSATIMIQAAQTGYQPAPTGRAPNTMVMNPTSKT